MNLPNMMSDNSKLIAKLDEVLAMQNKLEKDVALLKEGGVNASGGVGAVQDATQSRKRVGTMIGERKQSERSLSKKSSGRLDTSEEVGELAPVLIGDYLVLQDLGVSAPGYVCGDAAFRRCGIQKISMSHKTSLDYDDNVFQVFPALVYRSKQELDARKLARTNSFTQLRRSSSSLQGNEKEQEEKLLSDRIDHEEKLNKSVMNDVLNGTKREPLRYGQLIQLLHVKSGCFISCHHTAAMKDPACRKVSLREGSIAAQFALLPCFKAQTEGSVVFYTHSIKLGSVKLNGMFLHSSQTVYDDVVDSESDTLPRCLRNEYIYELNASAKFTVYVIKKYASYEPETHMEMKCAFTPFRLYHSQSESFINASCNADKNLGCDFHKKIIRKPIYKLEDNYVNEDAESFEAELPLHIPYLRNIEHQAGEEPDPTDPRNHVTKSVWIFESLSRTSSHTIGWGDEVRIRHLPSGRYLCVDLSTPCHAVPPREKWYRTYLIDEPCDDDDMKEDASFGTYSSSENAIFRIECDGASGDKIPLNDSNVRIEFRPQHSSLRLFLHNSEMKKPSQPHITSSSSGSGSHSSNSSSLMLVFSTQRSAQDTMKLMPISEEEKLATFRGKSFIPPSLAYATRLSETAMLMPSIEKYQETMQYLIGVISFQSKGKSEYKKKDWIKIANSMLPSAFSALFDGEPSPLNQRISRDLKLMDGIFAMGLAPYQRFKDPFPRDDMMDAAGIQKLVHVALQRMFIGNVKSQLYFGHRSAQAGKLLQGGAVPGAMPWIEIIKLQLEDPLGSAVSLSKLLSSNVKLLEEHATPPMVQEFARMIRQLGPQPRLVNFYEAICATGSSPVKSNQEMILRMTWMKPEDRSKLYLEINSISEKEISLYNQTSNTPYIIKKYNAIDRLPGDDLNNGSVVTLKNDSSVINTPKDYLGFSDDNLLSPIFVRWTGSNVWTQHMENELFFSPSELVQPLPSLHYNGHVFVRIEEFCWVLEPERLCEPITGIKLKQYHLLKETDDEFQVRFHRQEQIATYFIAELKMLSNLCFGRSYNCIKMLEESFPYTMLVSMIKNEYLPSIVRAVTLDLIRVLYLDRFPQMTNCARPSIPEMLWVYEAPGMSQEDLEATPVIKKISLQPSKSDTALALPCFQIPKAHKLSSDPNPLFSFPNQFKYFLLRTATNDIITSFGSGRINHSNRAMNQLASATVLVISDLLSFGFQSSYDKIHALLKGLVRLLDGRNDVRSLDMYAMDENPIEEEFTPLQARFELTTNSPMVTSVKSVVLDVFIAVSDFRTQFRLGKMMQIFKDYTENLENLKELSYFHTLIVNLEENAYKGYLEQQLYDQFEDLFINGDGKLLDFELLSNQPINTILLDCLMYKDDVLHAKALELLERTFTQRTRLLNAIKDVILLHRAPYYAQLNAEIGYLVYLLRSTEVWGISSKISGDFDQVKKKECFDMCDRVISYLNEPSIPVDISDGKSKMIILNNNDTSSSSKGRFIPHFNNTSLRDTVAPNTKSGGGLSEMNPLMEGRESVNDDAAGEDELRTPVHEHQDVLRAMNLQLALTKALAIDYNLVFKGSICTPEDKIESRNIHIQVMRRVVDMLTDFVAGNEKNQEIIFLTSISDLRRHLGDLIKPISSDEEFLSKDSIYAQQLITQPGLNTEQVIIECLRGNLRLCSEEIPRVLFEEFGQLLNDEPDVSTSRLLEFFNITILPDKKFDSLFRNQESTLDVMLSPKFNEIRQCIEGCFYLNHQSVPSQPQHMINTLSACIMNQNGITSSRLQANGYSIDATILALSKCLDHIEMNQSHHGASIIKKITINYIEATAGGGSGGSGGHRRRGSNHHHQHNGVNAVEGDGVHNLTKKDGFFSDEYISSRRALEKLLLTSGHFTSLVLFLSHQLRSLVIDPRLFRNDHIWRVLTDGVGYLISGFANDIKEIKEGVSATSVSLSAEDIQETQERILLSIPLIIPCLRIIHDFVSGAQRMSAEDAMLPHFSALKGKPQKVPGSIFSSLLKIRKVIDHSDISMKTNQPKKLLSESPKIIVSVRKLQYLLVPSSQAKDEEDVEITLNKFNEQQDKKLKKIDVREDDDEPTPAKYLSYFVEALTHNTKIQEKLLSRRFDFLILLESAEEKTKKDFTDNDDDDNDNNNDDDEGLFGGVGKGLGDAVNTLGNAVNTIGDTLDNAVHTVAHNVIGNIGCFNNGDYKFPEPEYGVKITWSMIVDRLVDFALAHNFDPKDEKDIMRVHNVFQNHILKARSDNSKVLDTSEMNPKQIIKYREYQSNLDNKGVTKMALQAIATHTPGLRGTAAVSAIELLQELLYSGNLQVQDSVLHYIEHVDKDSRFLKHIRSRLQESTRIVKERGEQISSGYVEMTRDQILEYEEAEQTLNLLSEMMEGHNFKLQNIIRSQPLQSADVDLLKMVHDLLDFQASQPHFLTRLSTSSVGLLISTLEFIVESMQGPCHGNQMSLQSNEATMAALKNILQSKFNKRMDDFTVMKIKSKAILVIAASLEGRKDLIIHEYLSNHLELPILNKFSSDATDFIKVLNAPNIKTDFNNNTIEDSKESEDVKRRLIDEACMQGLVALTNIRTEMNLIPKFAAAERQLLTDGQNKKYDKSNKDGKKDGKESKRSSSSHRRIKMDKDTKMMKSTVASVEVLWNERVEFVSFPLPLETEYLSSGSKSLFLEKVDLSTHEKRMKELIRAEPFLTAEMQQIYGLAQQSNLYKFMQQNFQTIKMIQYALVLLLNLNVVMASYGSDSETQNGAKKDLGYSSAFDAAFGDGMDKEYTTSLVLTFLLGIPNFLGYFFIMAFMGITEVPIIIRLIDNNVKEKRLEAQHGGEVDYRDPGAFTWWGVTLVFNIMFIIQHQAAYPNDRQPTLYLFLIFGINLPWTLLCVRNYILVADTPQARVFCIAFDTLVTKPFFRNQMFLVFCSVNGFRFSSYFTLMLLDVVNISPTIQSLVKSVTTPAPQLGIVAYLFIIMVIIFASFGLDFFEPFFAYDTDYDDDADDLVGPNPYGCHSVVACFWLIMYKGVPGGSLDGVLDIIDNRDPQYLGRVFFDLAFFVIVGIFLFNIITGLMVDTFSALREEAAARSDQLENECYVCGFTRTAYDDLGIPTSTFDQHKDRSHYIWNYLYFIQYLQEKDQTEFSGVESYVYQMLQTKSQDWLPARTSFAAQNHGISQNDDDALAKQMDEKLSNIEQSLISVNKKFHDIDNQISRMGEMISQK